MFICSCVQVYLNACCTAAGDCSVARQGFGNQQHPHGACSLAYKRIEPDALQPTPAEHVAIPVLVLDLFWLCSSCSACTAIFCTTRHADSCTCMAWLPGTMDSSAATLEHVQQQQRMAGCQPPVQMGSDSRFCCDHQALLFPVLWAAGCEQCSQ